MNSMASIASLLSCSRLHLRFLTRHGDSRVGCYALKRLSNSLDRRCFLSNLLGTKILLSSVVGSNCLHGRLARLRGLATHQANLHYLSIAEDDSEWRKIVRTESLNQIGTYSVFPVKRFAMLCWRFYSPQNPKDGSQRLEPFSVLIRLAFLSHLFSFEISEVPRGIREKTF